LDNVRLLFTLSASFVIEAAVAPTRPIYPTGPSVNSLKTALTQKESATQGTLRSATSRLVAPFAVETQNETHESRERGASAYRGIMAINKAPGGRREEEEEERRTGRGEKEKSRKRERANGRTKQIATTARARAKERERESERTNERLIETSVEQL